MSYRDALKIFNLEDNYTEKELKSVYYKLAKKNHPDLNGDLSSANMKQINLVYNILLSEFNKRKAKQLLDKWKEDIAKLKEKYVNSKIYDLCLLYEKKISNLTNYKDINDLKEEFDKQMTELKNEVALPIEKRKIIKSISKYLDGYSIEIKKLASKYSILITNTTSFEKLNTLKQKFDILLKEELVLERTRKEEFKNLKDSFKKASIYRFLEYSKNNTLNNIIYAHNELIISLLILETAKLDNMKEISEFLDNIKYKNIEEEYNKLTEFYFKLIGRDDYQYEKLDLDNKNISNDEIINLILDKYYLYATNKNTKIDKLIQNEKTFKDILTLINSFDDKKKNALLNFIKNESYKDIKIMLESFNDFENPNKIYIERSTGEICVINTNYKKIYTINLDGIVKNNINKNSDIFWKFMTLTNFFGMSNYTNGFEIDEVVDNKRLYLSDYYTNYLYYTESLVLSLSIKDDKVDFNFIPCKVGYKYSLGTNSQITEYDYFKVYRNKDLCLDDVLRYISNKIYKDNDKKKVK